MEPAAGPTSTHNCGVGKKISLVSVQVVFVFSGGFMDSRRREGDERCLSSGCVRQVCKYGIVDAARRRLCHAGYPINNVCKLQIP